MPPTDCEPSIEVIMKMGIQWGSGFGGGGQGGCGRSEVIVKIQKKVFGGGVGSGGGGRVRGGGSQGGCERRSEVL